jgi:hypothetical protein
LESGVKSFFLKFFILAGMLLGLPLLGVGLSGLPVEQYLEFPPETRYVKHAPFSWTAFTMFSLLGIAVIVPLVFQGMRTRRQGRPRQSASYTFPWWGWLGIVAGLIAWTLAWTRFGWFERFQPHTFTPLWFSLIVVINALTYWRRGRCMMVNRTAFFLLLFPLSAAFWWFFEYLNRFVQNWYYIDVHFSPWEYFWYATLPFSTVLPAVLGAQEWLRGTQWIEKGFGQYRGLRCSRPKSLALVVLLAAGVGLAGLGVWPNYLYPLLWVSPLLIIVSLQTLMGERHILSDFAGGDWRVTISSALAALFCGLFWEMWNYFSLAKWEYNIPFVHAFQIFEMPILGYGGYLPFGLECAVIGGMLSSIKRP